MSSSGVWGVGKLASGHRLEEKPDDFVAVGLGAPGIEHHFHLHADAQLLWIALGHHSNSMATRLHELVVDLPGVDLGPAPQVNSLFPRLPAAWIEPLRDWCFFWDWDVTVNQVRWMTAWDTTERDVERFAAGVGAVSAAAFEAARESL